MPFRYKVVPFRGQAKGELLASEIARQLETLIQQHASEGWEFCQLSDVNVEVHPGCLAGLLGAKVEYARFDQVIFRAPDGAAIRQEALIAPTNEAPIREKALIAPTSGDVVASPQVVRYGHVVGWTCPCGNVSPLDEWQCSRCQKRRSSKS